MTKSVCAYAKLNLILDVIGKRPDGYHDISSVMQSIELHDEIVLDVDPSDENEIKVSCLNAGDFSSVKWDETNLVYKAAELLLKKAGSRLSDKVRISVTVRKNIPAGAGMGGGSSDAAAVLKGLNELLDLGFSVNELCDMGAELGADVPFCVLGGTALCEGIGEKLTPLPSPGRLYCVILKPEISLSTKEMYCLTDNYIDSMPHPDAVLMKNALLSKDHAAFVSSCGNFMEYAAEEICPSIGALKHMLSEAGSELSLMTGSGSAVFGLFPDLESAKKAFEELDPPKAQKFISSFYDG